MKWFFLFCLCFSLQVHAQTADEIRRIMNPKSTYYDILGVSPNASEDEIKKAYRRLLKAYHPDRYDTDPVKKKAANIVLAKINPARDVLADAVARKKYDISIKVSSSAGANRPSGFSASEAKKWTPPDFGATDKNKSTTNAKSTETPKSESSQRTADKASSASASSSSNSSSTSDSTARSASRNSETATKTSSTKPSSSAADAATNSKNISPEAREAVKFYQDTARCGGEGFFKRFVDVML